MNTKNTRAYILPVLVAIILVAVFGLYLPFAGAMGHDMGCPFSFGGTALCPGSLAHMSHWQNAFIAVLVEILVFAALALLALAFFDTSLPALVERQHFRARVRAPMRPTLFQELFSQGILNRRAP